MFKSLKTIHNYRQKIKMIFNFLIIIIQIIPNGKILNYKQLKIKI